MTIRKLWKQSNDPVTWTVTIFVVVLRVFPFTCWPASCHNLPRSAKLVSVGLCQRPVDRVSWPCVRCTTVRQTPEHFPNYFTLGRFQRLPSCGNFPLYYGMMTPCEIQNLAVDTLDRKINNSVVFYRIVFPWKIPHCNGKCKVVPVKAVKVRRKRGGFYFQSFLTYWPRQYVVVSGQLHPPPTLPSRKNPGKFSKRFCVPRTDLDLLKTKFCRCRALISGSTSP